METVKKTCISCQKDFWVVAQEREILSRLGYPLGQKCPRCRERRRELLRSQEQFYKQLCARCKKPIVTIHNPEKGLIVYCNECYRQYYS